jgi:hypothetical protein
MRSGGQKAKFKPFALYKLIILDREGSERERWWTGHFGSKAVEPWGGRGNERKTAYEARGLMAENLRERLPEIEYY